MRLLLDTNILLDVLLSGRTGNATSTQILDLCEMGLHPGVVAWQTLPTVSYYYRKGHTDQETWDMLHDLVQFLAIPTVGKLDLLKAWSYSLKDFEDALQVCCAQADLVDVIITRNISDFVSSPVPAYTPEAFLALFGPSPAP